MKHYHQAMVYRSGKDGLVQEKLEVPKVGKNEALIKIEAAALNHRDEWILEGKYPKVKSPCILGSDGCGIVESVGNVDLRDWIGKEVVINPSMNWGKDPDVQSQDFKILGMPDNGTFSQYLAVPVKQLFEKPEHLSMNEAAALPLAGLTAYRTVFTKGEIRKGKKMLVTGTGGGVAQFAVQFAHAVEAEVFVTSGSLEKIEKAKDIGAVDGVNYKDDDWDRQLKDKAGLFDLIIDGAGGQEFNKLIDLAAPGGRIVNYGATTGIPKQFDIYKVFWKQLRILGSTMGNENDFREMLGFISSHTIKPAIDEIFVFEDINKAFKKMKNAHQFGKLVVKVG